MSRAGWRSRAKVEARREASRSLSEEEERLATLFQQVLGYNAGKAERSAKRVLSRRLGRCA